MRKFALLAAAASFAVALGIGPATAQPYGQGMMGGYGPGYGPGYGMMGPGYGPGPGYGMMGGYGPGYGMMGGYGPGYGMRGPGYGYHHGWMMNGYGPGYYGQQRDLKLSADDVKNYLDRMIDNPNLKVGDVKEKDADTIVASIVTKQGDSLVQQLEFNRHTGFYQPEQ
jgi:hypothetical protein